MHCVVEADPEMERARHMPENNFRERDGPPPIADGLCIDLPDPAPVSSNSASSQHRDLSAIRTPQNHTGSEYRPIECPYILTLRVYF